MSDWLARVERRRGLSEGELAEIRALAALCNTAEGLDLKLSWDLMQARSTAQVSDFCIVDSGQLIGYVALDGVGAELELTGMVHPHFRRQGIFRALVAAAQEECRQRGAEQLLLVAERASVAGRASALAIGGVYSFAEYHLEADAGAEQLARPLNGQLRLAQLADLPLLIALRSRSFGEGNGTAEERLAHYFHEPGSRYYLAMQQGDVVGSLGVVLEESGVYIRGVGVLPEFRGRGYGREMLAATMQTLMKEGQTHFALDVVTENERALGLYHSCGFRATNSYEYYELPLR